MKTSFNNLCITKNLTSLIGIVAMLVMISCGGGGAKQAEGDKADVKTKDETFKSVTKYPIPTSFEVVKLLNKAGASYILSLNNPIENADKYFTEKSKALNLGVYGANLSYASTYQMKQETMNYLNVSKKLIEELQITSAFNKDFAKKVEDNIDNKDELIQIITDSFYDTYEFLTNEGKDNISLLVMSGSWIEGLYITTQIALVSQNNEDMLKIIANQKDALNKLFELYEPVLNDPAIAEVKEMLKPLKEIYNGIDGETITAQQLNMIETEIAKVRTKVIS
jgi:hypothetical protein